MTTADTTFQELLHCANSLCHKQRVPRGSQQQVHKTKVYCDGEEAGAGSRGRLDSVPSLVWELESLPGYNPKIIFLTVNHVACLVPARPTGDR